MSADALVIDGSFGEGGGQILRTSLALSLLTGRLIRIDNIRARREKPGLQRQHLTAVQAAAAVSRAELAGASIGSSTLTFRPRAIQPGDYRFSVTTAGSTTLVLQTILPALLLADGPSEIMLSGGTHNPFAPPVHFLQRTFLPLLGRMGGHVELDLHRWGFYPAGGGQVTARIVPGRLTPIDLPERGEPVQVEALAAVANLPRHVAERELRVVGRMLDWPDHRLLVEVLPGEFGPGNVLLLTVACENVTEVFTAFGARGVPAEKVARQAVRQVRDYLAAEVPVGPHLADQLMLPLALAGGGQYLTGPLTEHARTNMEVIARFLPVRFTAEELAPGQWMVRVGSPSK